MGKLLNITFRAAMCLAISSCANPQKKESQNSQILHLEGPELQTLQFKSGLPGIGDDLIHSSVDPGVTLKQLRMNAELLKRVNWEKFNVIGATDDVECTAMECNQLSQRRATAVTEWLIDHGVPKSNLIPKGQGPYIGLGGAYTDGERRISRRVGIRILVTDADK